MVVMEKRRRTRIIFLFIFLILVLRLTEMNDRVMLKWRKEVLDPDFRVSD